MLTRQHFAMDKCTFDQTMTLRHAAGMSATVLLESKLSNQPSPRLTSGINMRRGSGLAKAHWASSPNASNPLNTNQLKNQPRGLVF